MKKDLENPIKLENGRMNPILFYPPAALLCPSEALCVGGCGGGRLWKRLPACLAIALASAEALGISSSELLK